MSQLPSGWAKVELGDCLQSVVGGGTPSRDVPAYFAGSIPWFTVKDLKVLKPSDAEEHISEDAVTNSATNVVPPNTLICATRIALGRAMRPTVRCAINQDLKALFPEEGINSDFLLYWIIANERMIQDKGSGTTVSGIRLEILKSLPLNLPPSTEQTRIVDKLEELLSDLDAGVADLNTAQRKLAQYRQSLLKAAAEGALTADWRAARGEPEETGAELLQRILAERRARWEQKQLAKFAEGKTPPKGWQAKYAEPSAPDSSALVPLPNSWAWASLGQAVSESLIGLDRGREHQSMSGRFGYIKMNNVSMTGDVETGNVTRIDANDEEALRYEIRVNDLLLNTRNSRELVGKAGLVRSINGPTLYNNNLMRIRFDGALLPDFACYQLCGPEFRSRMDKIKRATTSVAAVHAKDLFPLAIAVPPLGEQAEISEQLSRTLSEIDQQEFAIERALTQARAQRKNILKAAFAGRLVSQDPNDESASELLARIRAERVSNGGSVQRCRRKTA